MGAGVNIKTKGTVTSKFGTSGRINHDSSSFYNSRLYEEVQTELKEKYVESIIDAKLINQIYCKSSEVMDELPNNSVHLLITSPPYNVTKEYDKNLSLSEYLNLLNRVWKESFRVLVPGGRVCINVANLGRKPYLPLHSYIIESMLEIGFLMRGEIIWDKGSSSSASTAWGSWLSAANPVLRDIHEYILIFSKGNFTLPSRDKKSSLSKKEFLEYTKSIWKFPAASAKRIGHPAPFPEELPARLIKLYSFEEDVVLDPFVGSGTTCIAALKLKRNFVGYDIKEEYVKLANKKLDELKSQGNLFK
ncbi:MAG: site-specific DNA-methyltransferase [Ignavibacteriaceae bacterium]|nr:site-specific DNA-methyltransferase [Ignavibacteriaceae bacterium]